MVTQKVAFQGEPGAYGEMATLSQFPKAEATSCEIIPNRVSKSGIRGC